MIIITILTTSLIHFSLKGWENVRFLTCLRCPPRCVHCPATTRTDAFPTVPRTVAPHLHPQRKPVPSDAPAHARHCAPGPAVTQHHPHSPRQPICHSLITPLNPSKFTCPHPRRSLAVLRPARQPVPPYARWVAVSPRPPSIILAARSWRQLRHSSKSPPPSNRTNPSSPVRSRTSPTPSVSALLYRPAQVPAVTHAHRLVLLPAVSQSAEFKAGGDHIWDRSRSSSNYRLPEELWFWKTPYIFESSQKPDKLICFIFLVQRHPPARRAHLRQLTDLGIRYPIVKFGVILFLQEKRGNYLIGI